MSLLSQASLVMIPSGYKEDIVYCPKPTDGSGDLTFTRASDGTRVNSAGLVENVPWNLVRYSESIGTSPWLTNGATLTSGQSDPSGGTTAVKIELASGGNNYVYQGITLPNGINIVSAYLRADSATTIGFSMGGSTPNAVNLTTSWQLFTFSSADTSGGIIFDNYFGPSPTQQAKTFYIWHPQLNIGSTAKPYFPTTDRLNVPRLTYSGGCPSLLLEPQRTNEAQYSEQFDNAAWTKTEVTLTANDFTSPQGLNNAYSIVETTANNRHRIYNTISKATSAQDYCFSIFVKNKNGSRNVRLNLESGIGGNKATVVFDTSGNVVLSPTVSGSFTNATYFAEKIGDYWKYTLKATSDTSNLLIPIFLLNNGTTDVYLGDGTSGVYIWGAQVEAGSYPTSYIPTTSAAVTRLADSCYKTGISSLIGGTSGTVFFDITTNPVLSSASYKQFCYYFDASAAQSYMYLNSINQLSTNINWGSFVYSTPLVANTRYKVALVYAPNDFALYVNGVSVATASSGTPKDNVDLTIGQYSGTEMCEFVLNQYAHFPSRLTNTELVALTTL